MRTPQLLPAAICCIATLLFLPRPPRARADQPATATEPATQPATQPTDQFPQLTGDWYGSRKFLADHGIIVTADLMLDYSKNLSGGINARDAALRDLFEPTIEFDTKPLFNLDGGKIFIDLQQHTGPDASTTLVGDTQRFDSMDASSRTQIAQLWYEQTLLDGALRIKAGKVDANSEFDKPLNSQEFLNTGFTNSPTILDFPTYPDPATSINLFLKSTTGLYASAGVYDGSLHRGLPTGATGPATFFNDSRNLFLISEIGKTWTLNQNQLPGKLALGGWYSPDRFTQFNGATASQTGGSYAVLDQTLYRPANLPQGDSRGLGAFLMAGQADSAVSFIDAQLAAGFQWTAPFPTRNRDILGLGLSAAHLSSSAPTLRSHHEIAIESFYRIQFTPWISLKPDLQYITTPSGSHPDALVTTLRIEIDF